MKYQDLIPVVEAFSRGENVMRKLRETYGVNHNTPEIIEIAYDLQAGSYVDFVRDNEPLWTDYVTELAHILGAHVEPGDQILDVGTGELTTLAGVAPHGLSLASELYCCDLSWSRLRHGLRFLREMGWSSLRRDRPQAIVADLFDLPFGDGALDVVWTAHALEPNGGREHQALAELFRVARRKVILFEPSYETNTPEGKSRMDKLGYIKGLPDAIRELGGHCETVLHVEHAINPLNPTCAYVITPPKKASGNSFWACPATRLPMVRQEDCFWSESSLLAYPILKGIPILRKEAAILASGMRCG